MIGNRCAGPASDPLLVVVLGFCVALSQCANVVSNTCASDEMLVAGTCVDPPDGVGGMNGAGGAGGTAGGGAAGEGGHKATWGTAERIELNDEGEAENPQVAIGPNGHAVAVWVQYDGTSFDIWSNHSAPEGVWQTAERIETRNEAGAKDPQVAVDANGNAVAVWVQVDQGSQDIWSNRSTPDGGWGTAGRIEFGNDGRADDPQVDMDPAGNAVAVWTQLNQASFDIWSNRTTPSGPWGTAGPIEVQSNGGARDPQVAIDSAGDAVAVWTQIDQGLFDIWSNRSTRAVGWGIEERIELNDEATGAPQVAVSATGIAVAVWQHASKQIWSNRYSPGSGWGIAQRIEGNSGEAAEPQVAIDSDGRAVAVWRQSDGIGDNIWSNRTTPDGVWDTAKLIETDDTGSAEAPQVAMTPDGHTVAVWVQFDGASYNVLSTYSAPDGVWEAAELIEHDDDGAAETPQIAVDPDGTAVAVWVQNSGSSYDIWSNRLE